MKVTGFLFPSEWFRNRSFEESTLGDHTDTVKIYQKWILVRKVSILLFSLRR